MSRGDRFKVLFLTFTIILSSITVLLVVHQMNGRRLNFSVAEKIPASGFAPNDTEGKVPGNPQNAVNALQTIYTLSTKYKTQLDFACGQSSVDSRLVAVMTNPTRYGFRDVNSFMRTLMNPDDLFGDIHKAKAGGVIPYLMPCRRPDGTLIGSEKPEGTRDVIAYTSLYYYRNIRYFPNEKATYNPAGFYVVLWDDGQIEKVPYYDILYTKTVRKNNQGRAIAFKGQSGLMPGTMTYDENWKELGMERGPRGTAGGKGESPQDLALNPKK